MTEAKTHRYSRWVTEFDGGKPVGAFQQYADDPDGPWFGGPPSSRDWCICGHRRNRHDDEGFEECMADACDCASFCRDGQRPIEQTHPHEHVYRCQDCGEIGAGVPSATTDAQPWRSEASRDDVNYLLDTIIWMSGSADFNPEGQAGAEWERRRDRIHAILALHSKEPAEQHVIVHPDGVSEVVDGPSHTARLALMKKLPHVYMACAAPGAALCDDCEALRVFDQQEGCDHNRVRFNQHRGYVCVACDADRPRPVDASRDDVGHAGVWAPEVIVDAMESLRRIAQGLDDHDLCERDGRGCGLCFAKRQYPLRTADDLEAFLSDNADKRLVAAPSASHGEADVESAARRIREISWCTRAMATNADHIARAVFGLDQPPLTCEGRIQQAESFAGCARDATKFVGGKFYCDKCASAVADSAEGDDRG